MKSPVMSSIPLNSSSSVIAIPICQSLLVNTLRSRLTQYTTAVSAESVIRAGPYDLKSLAQGDSGVLEALRKVYAIALQRMYIVALSAGCAAAICSFAMEVKNVKKAEKERQLEVEEKRDGRGLEGDLELDFHQAGP